MKYMQIYKTKKFIFVIALTIVVIVALTFTFISIDNLFVTAQTNDLLLSYSSNQIICAAVIIYIPKPV